MWRPFSRSKKILAITTAGIGSAYCAYQLNQDKNSHGQSVRPLSSLISRNVAFAEALDKTQGLESHKNLWQAPSRQDMLNTMKGIDKDGNQFDQQYDLLIVGGGATGAGTAVDAATRGLKVALVERDDFASGTSSRSTKLVHGGVRYLQKAIMELDYEQYKLVVEALHERKIFLDIAPYLSGQLPIMLPVYKWWQIPYYWVGCKMYDFFAGREALESSYLLTRSKALEAFPMLKKDALVGALVYYDGQHNDARMNVALALTAAYHGATVANHCEVIDLTKDDNGIVNGAKLRDTLTGDEWFVKAKGVINATGPFTDGLRKMDDQTNADIVAPSAGVHIILPNYYSPRNMGLLDPATSDGRVIFFLPWQGNTIAGTTDSPTEVTQNPLPKEDEIKWILDEISHYLSADVKVRRSDVLAAWSGIRPLVRDPHAKNTESLVRSHMINVSENKLITIAGGKWTTYRSMAEETVDRAIEVFDLKPTENCQTERVMLIGSKGYTSTMFIRLVQEFGMDTEVAQHLANSYGDRAWVVSSINDATNMSYPVYGKRISPNYPYIEAEVRYAVRQEYACTAVDVLARRTRLAFLNAEASLQSLPRVIEIMSDELKWDEARQKEEFEKAAAFLITMGLAEKAAAKSSS
ncbi:mitochondrial glycerol-3-phosphate dehydrogenase [Apophysomyces sp. BC1034]|nr:mitochondrial glycerol-3-phosphate dehydrogenase [Apophysomyces sp. BC1015]KAG0181547.1 mitochondrial glycerol-3-phosphate dehydrogenase [Apophysomyces sp. BC1021]KAG0192090.1 mitochondrial glycerol-3-phosphate dehydrogenase [Apophysomyces sp. BC1034]